MHKTFLLFMLFFSFFTVPMEETSSQEKEESKGQKKEVFMATHQEEFSQDDCSDCLCILLALILSSDGSEN